MGFGSGGILAYQYFADCVIVKEGELVEIFHLV